MRLWPTKKMPIKKPKEKETEYEFDFTAIPAFLYAIGQLIVKYSIILAKYYWNVYPYTLPRKILNCYCLECQKHEQNLTRMKDDSESSDLEYIPSECLNKEFYRKHGGPGTALERIYNMLFDEDLESHEIRRLQMEAMEQHKQKQFQRDFNAALERKKA